MGQPITVVEKPSTSNPAVLRFEINRPLTGMGHERYTEAPGELMTRPVDELARRLFATGDVEAVHANGSVVTVTLLGGRTGAGLAEVIHGLFLYYREQPEGTAAAPPAEEPVDEADATPEALADTAEAPAADTAEAPAAEAAEEPAAEEPAAAEEPTPEG